ncbi:MAG: hypothetical protein QF402_16745 [Candidatus Latescibacteria bacterium]|nr:hypothetical protein [Candidatus Latescibacterota bacterium]
MAEQSTASIEAGHEVSDAPAGPVVKIGVAMALLVVVSFVGIVVLFKVLHYYQPLLQGESHPLSSTRVQTMSEEPLLESDTPRVRLAQNAVEDAALNNYTLDTETGTAKIPVDRAMDLLAERGLPVKTGTGAAGQ